jgi:hypothetical protein
MAIGEKNIIAMKGTEYSNQCTFIIITVIFSLRIPSWACSAEH